MFELAVAPTMEKVEAVAAHHLGGAAVRGCTVASEVLSNLCTALFRTVGSSVDTESASKSGRRCRPPQSLMPRSRRAAALERIQTEAQNLADAVRVRAVDRGGLGGSWR